MVQDRLLPELPEVEPTQAPTDGRQTRPGQARLYTAVRNQIEMVMRDLDSVLPQYHLARAIWAIVERLDLSAFYAPIKAVIGEPGHPATDPKVLVALWIYATSQGVGKARKLDRLCQEHDAYRWLRGGVPINYHMLSDFRVEHGQALNDLMTKILAAMMAEGLVKSNRVSQDGLKVRASAGAASFRREGKLNELLAAAREEVQCLAAEVDEPEQPTDQPSSSEGMLNEVVSQTLVAIDHLAAEGQEAEKASSPPGEGEEGPKVVCPEAMDQDQGVPAAVDQLGEAKSKASPREEAARKRAARERQKRIAQAVKEVPSVQAAKKTAKDKAKARVSTTDPDARVMRMPGGGFRPAFNIELATDTESQVIVGVSVTNKGNDAGQATPMRKQVEERCDKTPLDYLVDGDFATLEEVETFAAAGINFYAPTRTPRGESREQTEPRPSDPPAVADWRVRMGTDEAKAIYKERAASSECVNAQFRSRQGLYQLVVRGLAKLTSVALWMVITHNLLRWITLTT